MKEIKVSAIEHGTVIDHIPAGNVLKVVDILNLRNNDTVMIGMNLSSAKIGTKDIIKIDQRELSEHEVNSIALIAPNATMTIIKDYKVAKKIEMEIPEYVEGIIACPNPTCVTNVEGIKSKFRLTDRKSKQVRCVYCEKKYPVDSVKISL